MKTWRCGCYLDENGKQVRVCRQHITEGKRTMLNRNKRKQSKFGMYTQGFGDTYTQHKKKRA